MDQDSLSPGSCLCQRLCDGADSEGGNPSGAGPAGVLTRVSGELAQLPGRGFPDQTALKHTPLLRQPQVITWPQSQLLSHVST